ncbi:SRPBCC family protein [Nocardia sp. BSTN01]|uniref:SRPBCC family protein n=1 Tax=Nocardia sp. BSTN01 TaxID=2783665 RepID=UPI001890551F|nr:SRPBCC family protein [Nocardia sp. BSTN01]MBF4995865.1 SRPBCC family protein [Nocardia sp. BSTN01]
MTQQTSDTQVHVELTVEAPIDTAFDVFTTGMDSWWPREHHIGAGPLAEVVVEPRVGGRLLGREADGTECPWGRVLVWDRPGHFAFSWDISLDWKYQPDPALTSRVDVTFTPVDSTHTAVTLVHGDFGNHGEGWESMRDAVGSPGGWPGLADTYARAAAAAA